MVDMTEQELTLVYRIGTDQVVLKNNDGNLALFVENGNDLIFEGKGYEFVTTNSLIFEEEVTV